MLITELEAINNGGTGVVRRAHAREWLPPCDKALHCTLIRGTSGVLTKKRSCPAIGMSAVTD